MLNASWREALRAILTPKDKRLVIVGVGQERRGDDAIGVMIVRRLEEIMPSIDTMLLLEGGSAPQNITGQIRRFEPDEVLFVDAVDMQEPAGTVRLVDLQDEVLERVASTHTVSLGVIADYLRIELHCAVYLLGIQPAHITLDTSLSSSVDDSLHQVLKQFLLCSE